MERTVDCLARELEMDPVELRLRNLLRPEQFPYQSKTGWVYDSGDYERALRKALDLAGYDELRREQAERRERGELMGIGVSFFTEAVGAGPRKHMDIFGLAMNDGASLRVSPTGKAQLAISVQTQGQGHETTFAQIVAEELGIPPEDVDVVHGDTDTTPYGLGTYGSRSTPVSGAATGARGAQGPRARADRRGRDARGGARGPRVGRGPLVGVRATRRKGATIQEIAMAARGAIELPEGVEGGLDAEAVYDPPNLTFPFGAYVCVVDVDPGTAVVKVRRFVAVDDCGTRINPMIIEGQVHGGLTDGVGMALMEQIAFDEDGNCLGGSLMDYLIPTAVEVPDWETDFTVTPVAAPPDRARRGSASRRPSARRRRSSTRSATRSRPRRPARRHAVHAVPGVGRYGEQTGAMIKGELVTSRGAARDARAVRARDRRARGQRRPACGPATPRSCSPTAPSRASSAASCAQASVRLHAARALETGDALLLRLVPGRPTRARTRSQEGVVVVNNPCLSGGALEIFLEPHCRTPRIVVRGDTPIARALGRGRARGGLRAGVARRRAAGRPTPRSWSPRTARDEEPRSPRAARRASATSASWPAAGAARRCSTRSTCRRRCARSSTRPPGWTSARARRGDRALDPGRDRRRRAAGVAPRAAGARPPAIDPVCGMEVAVADTTPPRARRRTVYFCCEGCRDAYAAGRVGMPPLTRSSRDSSSRRAAQAPRPAEAVAAVRAGDARSTTPSRPRGVRVRPARRRAGRRRGRGARARRPVGRRRRRQRGLRHGLLIVDRRRDGGARPAGGRRSSCCSATSPGVSSATVAALLAGRGDADLAVCRYDDGLGHPFCFSRGSSPRCAGCTATRRCGSSSPRAATRWRRSRSTGRCRSTWTPGRTTRPYGHAAQVVARTAGA